MRSSLPGRHRRKRDSKERAADAITDGVNFVFAGRFLDGVERRKRPLPHIVLEALLREPRVGIDPGNAEDGEALIDAPFDEGLFRRQVEHVEFVDPRRNDQERTLEHGFGRGRVLNELHQLVLEDHLARRDGEVAADLEHRRIGLPDFQVAAAGFDVLGKHVHAANEVVGIGDECLTQQFGVGQDEIRRRQRIGDLPHVEFGFLPGVGTEIGGVADQLAGPVRGEEIGLFEKIEELVLRPFRVGKALVAGSGRCDRRDVLAGEPLCRGPPKIEIGLAQPVLQFGGALRVGKPIFRDLAERLHDFSDFFGEFAVAAACFTRLEIGGERPAAFLDDPRQIAREQLDIERPDFHRDPLYRVCRRFLFCRVVGWSPHERSFVAEGFPVLTAEMA